jgi:Ca-activated chloride channel family protein
MHVNAHLDVDVLALEQDDTVTVLLELQAPAAPATSDTRPPHTVVVVLDRSGSMDGPRLFAAKAALLSLIDRLDDNDRLGVVTFDDQAQVVLPARALATHTREHARAAVGAIQTGGMTDLSSGYLRGLQEARRAAGDTGATLILLSDGQANSGITDDVALKGVAADALGKGITTSTVGIGLGYDETILTALAAGGSGNHSFAERAEAAATAVAAEIDGLLTKAAQAASLLVRPSAEITGISVLNDLPSSLTDDGVVVELGDFWAGETRRLVLQIDVPGRPALGVAQVAELELRYVELPQLVEHTVMLPLSVNVLPGDEAAGRVRKPEVEREKLLLTVQAAKQRGEDALRDGDREGARMALESAHELLASAPMPSAALMAETAWFAETLGHLDERDDDYNRKRMSASRAKMSRGTRDRIAGGEVGLDS